MNHKDLQTAISEYANAYGVLEAFQSKFASIPAGDQKTGCIGEYYAFVYLGVKYPHSELSFGNHSEKGWDIKVDAPKNLKIQVKTVSGFSKTKALSPIHPGWDQLFIILLDKELKPKGFWIIDDTSILKGKERLIGIRCKNPGNPKSGSKIIGSSLFSVGRLRIASLQPLSPTTLC